MSLESGNVSSYFSNSGLTELKRNIGGEKTDAAIKQVARQFESMFVQIMMKNMRSATPGDSLLGSDAVDQYQDMHDKQMSIDLCSNGKGFGIAALVEKQIRMQQGLPIESDADVAARDGAQELNLRRFYGTSTSGKAVVSSRKDLTEPSVKATEPVVAAKPEKAGLERAANVVKQNIIEGGSKVVGEKTLAKSAKVMSGGKMAVFTTPEEFVEGVWDKAKSAAAELGVDPAVLVAQAALETGWGKHVISDGDSKGYNFFGIKADRSWQGDRIRVSTLEYMGGVPKRLKDDFRSYDSIEESFNDYVAFLKDNPRYANALQNSDNPYLYTQSLQEAGYATDPKYASKILRVMNNGAITEKAAAEISIEVENRVENRAGSKSG
ncbi:MAG: flagellar assembly peptidoglycan hydrolase FlgJ [Gammaproteobacteria bacterium]|nr:MAG: flagellar assembly peptidoglycan hydrolase FlgJ [Gammaproteobacteria bacterium]